MAIDTYSGLNSECRHLHTSSVNDYQERISYDPNGNILTYVRNGDATRPTILPALKREITRDDKVFKNDKNEY